MDQGALLLSLVLFRWVELAEEMEDGKVVLGEAERRVPKKSA